MTKKEIATKLVRDYGMKMQKRVGYNWTYMTNDESIAYYTAHCTKPQMLEKLKYFEAKKG